MVSFSNTDGARYDSERSQCTVLSKSIQIDVKVPVQPSTFDILQEGALMGAPTFMEYDKTYIYQPIYAAEFIPSPGTTLLSMDVNRRPFLHLKSCCYCYHPPTPYRLNST